MTPEARASDATQRETGEAAPTYARAGVSLGAGDRLVPRFKALAAAATRPEVVGGVGAFSGLFDLSGFPNPLLVASTDGVGTKVLLARMLNRFDGVGQDLVNHCANDILTAGAQPLFFLDYLAGYGLSEDETVALVGGVATACRETGTALLGGETADMPGLYRDGDFDLAGTIVGVVEKGREIDGRHVEPGDVLLGLPSNGLHTSGYSLARAVFDLRADDAAAARETLNTTHAALSGTLADALLRPHRAYWPLLEPALPQLKAIAHITGGGLPGNLSRVLPSGTQARLRRGSWPEPPIFRLIQETGAIGAEEMLHVFNMGLGLVCAVAPAEVDEVRRTIGEFLVVGEIVAAGAGEPVQIEGTAG